MLEAAHAIEQHVVNKSMADLEENRLLLGGVIRELLLIGEAANAVSEQTKAKISQIPWREVIGMRNQLIHGYFDISYKIIWSTVMNDIPQLISALEKTLRSNSL